MKKIFIYACVLVVALLSQGPAGAVVTEDLNIRTGQDLADALFAGSGATVLPTAVHSGDPAAAGLFTGGLADGLGIDAGIILSTGDIFNAEITPNIDTAISTSFGLPGDADVSAAAQGQTTFDASALEFDFIPSGNVLDFTFVLASDEYNEVTGGGTFGNDTLVLLIDGVNFALVPKTTTAAAVGSINLNTNSLLFNNNDPDSFPFPLSPPFATQYDGFSAVLTSRAVVAPGRTYHIKIAVADEVDEFLDTSFFLAPVTALTLPVDTIGVYESGVWNLDINGNGVFDGTPADAFYFFGGMPGALPVSGDWNNTGTSKIGIYANGYWYLDINGNGAWDGTPTDSLHFFGGMPGAFPVSGDWNNTGISRIGIYADGYWYLDINGNGVWDGTPTDSLHFFGGMPGALPVSGDWNGTGSTKIGIYADGTWYLDMNGNGLWDGIPTDSLHFFGGMPGALPVTGNWSGLGSATKIGVFASGTWYLDYDGNGAWHSSLDVMHNFGSEGQLPFAGKWN